MSWALAPISLCFLTAEAMGPAASHSHHHAFPTMTDYAGILQQKKSLLPSIVLYQIFHHRNKRNSKYIPFVGFCLCLGLGFLLLVLGIESTFEPTLYLLFSNSLTKLPKLALSLQSSCLILSSGWD